MSSRTDRGAGRRLDFICGLVLTAASMVVLIWIIPGTVPGEASRGEVAPSFFPNLTAGVVLVCSVALVLANRGAVSMRLGTEGWRTLGELAGWAVLSVTIWLLLRHLGFIAASIAATAVFTLVSRYRGRLWLVALIAILLPVALRFGVQALFGITLP